MLCIQFSCSAPSAQITLQCRMRNIRCTGACSACSALFCPINPFVQGKLAPMCPLALPSTNCAYCTHASCIFRSSYHSGYIAEQNYEHPNVLSALIQCAVSLVCLVLFYSDCSLAIQCTLVFILAAAEIKQLHQLPESPPAPFHTSLHALSSGCLPGRV